MNTHEVLIGSKAVIADPKNWVIGIRHHPDGGHCALGAIEIAANIPKYSPLCDHPAVIALAQAARSLGYTEEVNPSAVVAQFNNTLGHAKTMAMFDIAIEATKPRKTDISSLTALLNTKALVEA